MKNKETLEDQFGDKIKSRLEEHTKKLYNHQKNLEYMDIPVDVSQILEMLARDRSISIPGADKNRANLGQALTAILFGDPELVVAAGGGKQGTIDFLVDMIKTNVLDMVVTYILFAVVGNIWALVPFIIVKNAKANARGESITEKMIAETKNMLLNGEETSEDSELTLCLSKEGKALFISKTETPLTEEGIKALATGTED
ncbi:MAG: hypothetical protein IJW67_08610 [Blautia sp.]|nr:hypothetical protein [Blautia sp.]